MKQKPLYPNPYKPYRRRERKPWYFSLPFDCDICGEHKDEDVEHTCECCGKKVCAECWVKNKNFDAPMFSEMQALHWNRYCPKCHKEKSNEYNRDMDKHFSQNSETVEETLQKEEDYRQEQIKYMEKHPEIFSYSWDDNHEEDNNEDSDQDSNSSQCPNCGSEEDNLISCSGCGRTICKSCSHTEGLIRKKHYCYSCTGSDDEVECDDCEDCN